MSIDFDIRNGLTEDELKQALDLNEEIKEEFEGVTSQKAKQKIYSEISGKVQSMLDELTSEKEDKTEEVERLKKRIARRNRKSDNVEFESEGFKDDKKKAEKRISELNNMIKVLKELAGDGEGTGIINEVYSEISLEKQDFSDGSKVDITDDNLPKDESKKVTITLAGGRPLDLEIDKGYPSEVLQKIFKPDNKTVLATPDEVRHLLSQGVIDESGKVIANQDDNKTELTFGDIEKVLKEYRAAKASQNQGGQDVYLRGPVRELKYDADAQSITLIFGRRTIVLEGISTSTKIHLYSASENIFPDQQDPLLKNIFWADEKVSLFDSYNPLSTTVDPTSKLRFISDYSQATNGVDYSEDLGNNLQDLFPGEELTTANNLITEIIGDLFSTVETPSIMLTQQWPKIINKLNNYPPPKRGKIIQAVIATIAKKAPNRFSTFFTPVVEQLIQFLSTDDPTKPHQARDEYDGAIILLLKTKTANKDDTVWNNYFAKKDANGIWTPGSWDWKDQSGSYGAAVGSNTHALNLYKKLAINFGDGVPPAVDTAIANENSFRQTYYGGFGNAAAEFRAKYTNLHDNPGILDSLDLGEWQTFFERIYNGLFNSDGSGKVLPHDQAWGAIMNAISTDGDIEGNDQDELLVHFVELFRLGYFSHDFAKELFKSIGGDLISWFNNDTGDGHATAEDTVVGYINSILAVP